MQDERIIALGLGRHAKAEMGEFIRLGGFGPPFVQTERRVGDNHIIMAKCVVFGAQFGVADRIALFDLTVILAMQEQVHLGQRPSGANCLLSKQRVKFGAGAFTDQPTAFHQQRC